MPSVKKKKSPQVVYVQAGNWRRILAFFIDCLIIAIPNSAIILFLSDNGLYSHVALYYGFLLTGVTLAYFIFFTHKNDGQTIGKMVMNIRTIGWEGTLNSNKIIIRYAFLFAIIQFDGLYHLLTGSALSIVGVILQFLAMMLVLCLLLIDDKRRGIHDLLAGTWVVRVQNQESRVKY